MKKLRIFLALLLFILCFPHKVITKYTDYSYEINSFFNLTLFNEVKALENNKNTIENNKIKDVFNGTVTAYTPYCTGCSGITAFGYDVRNNMYYNDIFYGNLRILAAPSTIPFGSIIRLTNFSDNTNIIAIVLDRGSAISINGSSQGDLLFLSLNDALKFGRKANITFEVLRYGF